MRAAACRSEPPLPTQRWGLRAWGPGGVPAKPHRGCFSLSVWCRRLHRRGLHKKPTSPKSARLLTSSLPALSADSVLAGDDLLAHTRWAAQTLVLVGRAGIRSDGSNMFIAEREGRRHAEQHGIDARHHADAVHTTKCAPATAAAAASRRIIKMMKPLLPLLCPRLRFVSVSDAACPLGLAHRSQARVARESVAAAADAASARRA